MNSITMAIACGILQISVMIYGTGAPDDFIATITIYICHTHVMIAVSVSRLTAISQTSGILRVSIALHIPVTVIVHRAGTAGRSMKPLGRELFTIEIDSPKICTGIVATHHHSTRQLVLTIKIRHSSQITLTAIGIVIPPERFVGRICPHLIESTCAIRIIPDGMDGSSRFTIEYGEVFWTTHNIAIRCTINQRVIL